MSGLTAIQIDWSGSLDLVSNFDVVVHAAGLDASKCAENPQLANEINYINTCKLVQKVNEHKLSRFFYLSTVHVYKSGLAGYVNEASPLLNEHPYATSHWMAEKVITDTLSSSQTLYASLRLSNVFGAPSNSNVACWDLVVNNFVMQAVKTRQIILSGNPNSSRDFVYIKSLKHFFKFLMQADDFPLDVLNFSAARSFSILQAAMIIKKKIERKFGFDVCIVQGKSERNDNLMEQREELFIDNDVIEKWWGETPICFENGIEDFIEDFIFAHSLER